MADRLVDLVSGSLYGDRPTKHEFIFKKKETQMYKIGDKIEIEWCQADGNGHFDGEKEVITISRIDDIFYYDDEKAIELERSFYDKR